MTKNKFHALTDALLNPVKSSLFLYLLLLNFVSNLADLVYDQSAFAIFSMVMLAAMLSYIETAIYKVLSLKWPRIIFLLCVVLYHNILIATDYFLVYQFNMAIGQDVVDILAETNPVEAQNFLDTYLTLPLFILLLVAILLFNILIMGIVQLIKLTPYKWPAFGCSFIGVVIMIICMYNFALYRNGMSIPQYQTTTRLGYSIYVMKQRLQKIVTLRGVCQATDAVSTLEDKPTIVVVIGESFCVYHSSLFGYEKETNPLLKKRVNDGTMQVFDNVVSVACGTHGAMLSVFSLDSMGKGFDKTPLFPACFKAAGYKTAMYDNQYFVGSGVNFLSDAELSAILFDKRNNQRYTYDLQMIEKIRVKSEPSLNIIHLWGQHYTYSQRYPDSFRHFKASDYDEKRWNEKQREIIAHYDNATLYNDYVVNEIIKKFEKTNCCVVYFSDHGEEIYDLSNYMGHGNAMYSKDISYQIRVPLMVWTSPSFSRPELKEKIASSNHLPLMTDDISHFILEIAGIQTANFDPTRSFINQKYNKNKKRTVLRFIDYDKRMMRR